MEDKEVKCVMLEITLFDDGQFSVKCPRLGDTMLILGMLEMAKATAFQFKANQLNQEKIIKPRGNIMDFVRKRFA
jgi:hypothetical protein